MTITSPPYSFVQFAAQLSAGVDWHEEPIPGADLGWCLPVASPTDLQFQLFVDGTKAEIDYFCTNANLFQLAIRAGSPAPSFTLAQASAVWTSGQFSFEKYRLSETRVLIQMPLPPNFTDTADCGDCFQIGLFFADGTPVETSAASNCMSKVCDTEYSTRIEYYSEEDEAGFVYCQSPTLKNVVRLPFYLTRPTYPEDEAIYRRTDGTSDVTRSSVREVWEVVCDAMPRWTLQCLRAIFLHEVKTVSSLPYTGDIQKEGAFDVDWSTFLNYPLATAKFKVAALPVLMQANNCGDCEELAYGIIASNYSLPGAPTPTNVYSIDLATLTSSPCCSPVAWEVLTTLPPYVQGTNIVGSTLYITYQQSAKPPENVSALVVTWRAKCGNAISNTGKIYAQI